MVDMNPNPMYFFSTAAGPDASDLYGPPQSALDLYANGTPIASAQTAIANGIGNGGRTAFWMRPDVHGLILLVTGAAMVHLHMEAE